MIQNMDEVQKLGKDNLDLAMKSFGTLSKSMQAIAVEMADYSKKSFETGTAAAEQLFGARTLDRAVEIQSDYLKNSYEGFVAQAAKMGELYADLARETYKPYEGVLGKMPQSR